ncbi:MAG TPA: hypothetical protein VM103_01150 [Candidatus Paceibacterota bacterium]|nr:hypothetical protein [Candidatus Paceibacterota bacterium]
MQPHTTTTQANVEFWFRQFYELWFRLLHLDSGSLAMLATTWWNRITAIGYTLSILGLLVITYATVRLYELRQREKEQYGAIHLAEEAETENPRWKHIQSLMESGSVSDWRQAIIEADIMLDDMLMRQGYSGESIGDKLKQVEPSDFDNLDNAWEAHKVRNRIAHDGSAFDLSQTLAQRTIARYEAVFREFRAI